MNRAHDEVNPLSELRTEIGLKPCGRRANRRTWSSLSLPRMPVKNGPDRAPTGGSADLRNGSAMDLPVEVGINPVDRGDPEVRRIGLLPEIVGRDVWKSARWGSRLDRRKNGYPSAADKRSPSASRKPGKRNFHCGSELVTMSRLRVRRSGAQSCRGHSSHKTYETLAETNSVPVSVPRRRPGPDGSGSRSASSCGGVRSGTLHGIPRQLRLNSEMITLPTP